METLPNCPKCNSEYVYEDGSLLVCPECAYEWNPDEVVEEDGVVEWMLTEIVWRMVTPLRSSKI